MANRLAPAGRPSGIRRADWQGGLPAWRRARGPAVAIALALLLAGCTDFSETLENRLKIVDIDVAAPEVRAGTVRLVVTTTLDNADARSGELSLVLKAYDEATGILVATDLVEIGRLPQDRSMSVAGSVEVARAAAIRFVVQVSEADRIVLTGRVTTTNLASLEPTIHDTGISVGQIDVEVEKVEDNRAFLRVTSYLTNEGRQSSGDLVLQLKAREVSTALIAAEADAPVTPIGPDETARTSVIIDVPDGFNYLLEAVLWQALIIVETGSGQVQLLPTFEVDPRKQIAVSDPDISQFVRQDARTSRDEFEGDSSTGAPAGAIVLLIVAIGAVAWTRRQT